MYKGKEYRLFVLTLLATDALGIAAALALAYYLRIGSRLFPYQAQTDPADYVRLGLMVIPLWLAVFAASRLYHPGELLGGPQEYGRVVTGCTFGVVILVLIVFFDRVIVPSRLWLLLVWVLSILIIGVSRFSLRRVAYALRRKGLFITRAVIVGTDEQARSIARQFQPPTRHGVEILGFVDDFKPEGTTVLGDLRVIGSPDRLFDLVRRLGVEQVIIVPGALAWESAQEILHQASTAGNGPQIQLAPGFYEMLSSRVRTNYRGFVPLLTLEMSRIGGIDALLKAALDYTLGVIGLLLALPFMLMVALALKIARAPRVLVYPQVTGQGGQIFTAPVFWSAREEETNPGGPAHRLGAFLYRSGLSKLPQLFCVLRGKMSLVGPRPISPEQTAAYGRWLPNRLMVRPGLTGPWVSVAANPIPLAEEIRLDMYYIRNWTIWLDLQILFQTVLRMLHLERGRWGQRPENHPMTKEEAEWTKKY